jgi:hypothetical protein
VLQVHKHKIPACDLQKSSSIWITCSIYKILAEKVLLDHCPAHPSAYVLKLKDEKIRGMFLTKNIAALIQPIDQGIIQASKAFYHGELLGGVVNSELQTMEFLETLTLKDVAHSVELTWGKVTPTAIANCQKKCIGKVVTEDKTKLIQFPNNDMKAAYSTLSSNLVSDDVAA